MQSSLWTSQWVGAQYCSMFQCTNANAKQNSVKVELRGIFGKKANGPAASSGSRTRTCAPPALHTCTSNVLSMQCALHTCTSTPLPYPSPRFNMRLFLKWLIRDTYHWTLSSPHTIPFVAVDIDDSRMTTQFWWVFYFSVCLASRFFLLPICQLHYCPIHNTHDWSINCGQADS